MDELLLSIEKSLESKNWYAALAVALIIPDICGKIDNPQMNPGGRYPIWYEKYVNGYLKTHNDIMPKLFTGFDCYAVRCAMLHEFSEDLTSHNARKIIDKYRFCNPDTCCFGASFKEAGNQMEINVEEFCEWIRIGVNIWSQESGHSADEINNMVKIW